MAVNRIELTLPGGGLDTTSLPIAVPDGAAVSLENLQMVGSNLESIRGYQPFPTRLSGGGVTSICVFRRKSGLRQIVFAFDGKVYWMDELNPPKLIYAFASTTDAVELLQFFDYLYIFNGVEDNLVYDGLKVTKMGVVAPMAAPTVTGTVGSTSIRLTYCYYNSERGIESNPSPETTFLSGSTMTFTVTPTASSDTQVDKIRIYRTGSGFSTPRLALETPNAAGAVTVNALDDIVSNHSKVRYDRDPPQKFIKATGGSGRIRGWEKDGDIGWVSNLTEPEYFPSVPILDKTNAVSGGPIDIRPGDGDSIQMLIDWGGMMLAFKRNTVYRIQEAEIGFWSVQPMPIDGCISPNSVSLMADGLMWRSHNGIMHLDFEEVQTLVGFPIRRTSNGMQDVSATTSRGRYLIGYSGKVMTYLAEQGWYGEHDVPASCWFEDIDGTLWFGNSNKPEIAKYWLNDFGVQPFEQQASSIPFEWKTGALSHGMPGIYKRVRSIDIYGRDFGSNQNLSFTVYDVDGNTIVSYDFSFPSEGVVRMPCAWETYHEYFQYSITGATTAPIQISGVYVTIETGATIQE